MLSLTCRYGRASVIDPNPCRFPGHQVECDQVGAGDCTGRGPGANRPPRAARRRPDQRSRLSHRARQGLRPDTSLRTGAASFLTACQRTVEKRRSTEESRIGVLLTLVTRRFRTCKEIRIKDNSSSVSPEFTEMTLRPFFATRQTHPDSGTGLALPGEIVLRRGDEIRVSSAPGVINALLSAERQSEPGDDGIPDTLDNGPEHIT